MKAIDKAIKALDSSKSDVYKMIKNDANEAVGNKYGFITNLSDLETAMKDAKRHGQKEDYAKLKHIYNKYN